MKTARGYSDGPWAADTPTGRGPDERLRHPAI